MPAPSPIPIPAAAQLAQRLAQPKPMRHGSVGERYMKCSKPGCACATDPDARHGPYTSLTSSVKGKTKSRYLTPEQAGLARRQIDAGREFQHNIDDYWKVCEKWADQELGGDPTATATAGAVKKGGSKRASRKRSPRKSAG
jgi:hypothetical protein